MISITCFKCRRYYATLGGGRHGVRAIEAIAMMLFGDIGGDAGRHAGARADYAMIRASAMMSERARRQRHSRLDERDAAVMQMGKIPAWYALLDRQQSGQRADALQAFFAAQRTARQRARAPRL